MVDNQCQTRATLKCQAVLVDMDVANRARERDGTRVKARATASAMATKATKAKHCILLAMLKRITDTTIGRSPKMVCKSEQISKRVI
jgi:hypothetical protein